MTQPDPRYVSASQPVNRRTAKPIDQPEQINPLVQERLAAKWASQHAKGKFGLPMAEQLHTPRQAGQKPTIAPLFIVGGVISAVSAVSLLLATIQQSVVFAGVGAVALVGGVGLMVFSRRQEAMRPLENSTTTALFDDVSVQAFDRALANMVTDTPDEITAELGRLKLRLVRIAQLGARTAIDEHFTLDDRLYLTELMRRYLPDSLHAYLQVPKDQRLAPVLVHGATASSLLMGQLQILCGELDKQEKKLLMNKEI